MSILPYCHGQLYPSVHSPVDNLYSAKGTTSSDISHGDFINYNYQCLRLRRALSFEVNPSLCLVIES